MSSGLRPDRDTLGDLMLAMQRAVASAMAAAARWGVSPVCGDDGERACGDGERGGGDEGRKRGGDGERVGRNHPPLCV
eukprot:CAMPEP_0175943182 /NCGR_PEP_ID=MMETSP0108-20121206/25397_1 /TAXON_ID=195067 ORGANISM="Goniomonas pacifica, Strain CCMP1869" /NCGR_SAMPLE_ID=MMETSP0108 /ASSEMBLY_ACC=CAM_ASM_000204 /LENGTH=77 /DNA_ID=CAMNT_0017268091 /DNA_START=125 /DNA_END=358 /DNA_ORIENTATION=-